MKKNRIIIILLLITNYITFSYYSPYSFLRFNSSGRASALAGCFVSMPNDASAMFFNPATISTVNNKKFTATFLKHILDINSGNIAYIHNFENFGTFSGAIVFTNYGSFDGADEYGNKTNAFSANDLAIQTQYSNKLDTNLYYGIGIKFIFSNIEKATSTAFALDVGLIYLMPDIRTNIGISILNAGAQLSKFDNTTEDLPLDVRIGINHRLRGLPLLVNLSFHSLADRTDGFFDKFLNFSIAGEFYLGEMVQLRLGYDNKIRRMTMPENERKLSGFSVGLGFKTDVLNFDYGLSQMGNSSLLHRFTIGLDF